MTKKTIFAIGDSHARPFLLNSANNRLLNYDFDIVGRGIGMASARGLARDDSATKSFQKFMKSYHKINRKVDVLCLNFGQVDVEYVYPYRSYIKKIDQDFADFVRETIAAYMEGIARLAHLSDDKIIVKGINFPVIHSRKRAIENTIRQLRIDTLENLTPVEVKALREQIAENFPHFPRRRGRALFFNKMLKAECERRGYEYFDVLGEIFDEETRRVKFELLPYDALEHHLTNNLLTQKIYLDALASRLEKQEA